MPILPSDSSSATQPRYSIVIPVLNEAVVLPALLARIDALLKCVKTRDLLVAAGLTSPEFRYFVFMPSTRPWASRLERRLAWLPLGAQYAAFARA